MTYAAPVRDIVSSLTHAAGVFDLARIAPFLDFDKDTLEAVLGGAAELTEGVLAPLNRSGDVEGARFENGAVRSATGFIEAYAAYCAGGWNGLAAAPEHGGQGLPKAVSLAVFEMVHAANMAFGLCPMLSEAAIEALSQHGTERQKTLYLPRLVSGAWTGTMNLTEPQAGSDLSLVSARAVPDGEGGYRLTGQKIYITWGDHDLADNIIHLVLARLPDAPAGVKGISLFLAPKRLVNADGGLGPANTLRPGSIEHKLGIRASPTCVMLFEDARAELVGRENQGLAHMFTMMNAARLNVGVEGVGIGERAFQQALAYAGDRRQGRSPWSADPVAAIIDQPDVRRMLAQMKAKIAAARGLCFTTAVAGDLALYAEAPEERARAKRREEFLTPLAKAWSTDVGVEAASLGVQVHGGMGFIEETGAAQHYRDARIAPIYEGTNGIQAVDLVGRKLSLEGGLAFREFLEDLRVGAAAIKDDALAGLRARIIAGADAAERAGGRLALLKGDGGALAGASAFLELTATTFGGLMLAREADGAEPAAKAAKTALARFYADQVLSALEGLETRASAGAADLLDLTPARLAG